MINVRGLANGATSTVNNNAIVRLRRSAGYTMGAGRKQVPTYADPVDGPAQVQALDSDDIAQIAGLNIQGAVRAIYMYGPLAGVLRPDQIGGDLIDIPPLGQLPGADGTQTWLVVKVLETWPTWTKAAIVLQGQ